MKRCLLAVVVIILSLSTVHSAWAQDPTKVVVDKSLLTPEQLAKVESNQKVDKVKEISQFAGMGKEIGEGVNGALSAITDNANKFADTRAGVFTMWIVAFKVLGGEAIRFFMALVFMTVFTVVFVWIWVKNFMPRRMLAEETVGPDKARTKKYLYFPKDFEKASEQHMSSREERTIYAIVYAALLLITLAVGSC